MNANKTIHEAMGLCWHEWSEKETERPQIGRQECKCGEWTYTGEYQTDYTDPVHYYNLFKWMRNDDRWRIFGNWLMRTHGDSQFRFLMKVEEHQIDHIAEAIEDGVLS